MDNESLLREGECSHPNCIEPAGHQGPHGVSLLHCWKDGPMTEDGCGTTCMKEAGHEPPHEWMRDDQIRISFAP